MQIAAKACVESAWASKFANEALAQAAPVPDWAVANVLTSPDLAVKLLRPLVKLPLVKLPLTTALETIPSARVR